MSISKKTEWIKTNGWHGYNEPVNAIAGCNDTGSWEDSPCRSSIRKTEVKEFCSILKQNKIQYVTMWCETSNAFCAKQFVLVAPENRAKAIELAKIHVNNTRLFYVIEK